MKEKEVHASSWWIQWWVVASCAVFIFVLILSAVYDPSIRVLHAFQAGIYVTIVILARRDRAWGYGAGCFIAALWNWTNLVYTTFVANGLRELLRLLETGEVKRPDQLIAVLAATTHFVLLGTCVLGYFRIKSKTFWTPLKFFGGGLSAISYFAVIIILFGPQYVPLLRRVFGI